MPTLRRLTVAAVAFATLLAGLALAARAGTPDCRPTPTPSPGASAAPGAALAGEDENPNPRSPLYSMGQDINTIDRSTTLFYYFQSNKDGSAKVKQELRYGRDLWNDCAQLRIR
ncbi:MAG: hypothetical protein JO199_11055, partial [Candidatus Eremiobacteraeota bacterium]|nr:hypothetical protein [Candidatus Eremiobacteraeota bacterium]